MGPKGYIALYRSIKKNFVWKDKPFTKGQAWIDILLEANHADGGFFKRGVWVEVKRGQDGRSELTLADEWGWSRGKVRRFLAMLKNEQMIELKQDNKTTIITICNYEHYQPKKIFDDTPNGTADGTPNGHQTDTKRYINNKNKKNNNENKKDIYTDTFLILWSNCPNPGDAKKQTFKNYNKTMQVYGWTEDQICTACNNYYQIQQHKGNSYPYRLSNLVGEKYREILPDYLKKDMVSETFSMDVKGEDLA